VEGFVLGGGWATTGAGRVGLGCATTGGGAAVTATVSAFVSEGSRQDWAMVIATGPRWNCTSTVSPLATVALGDPSMFSCAAAPRLLVSRILVSAPTVMLGVLGFESQSSPATPDEVKVTSAPGAAEAVLAAGNPANAPRIAIVANRLSISSTPGGRRCGTLGLTEY
jgi:hypothetical protein